jgi:hypothetical protein
LVKKTKIGSTQNELVECDLEFVSFQKELEQLETAELDTVLKKIETINQMTWAQVYSTSSKGAEKRGLNWEVLGAQKTATGGVIASIRLSKKFRARVTRDGVLMRFISLHPDHDSAYEARGGEVI